MAVLGSFLGVFGPSWGDLGLSWGGLAALLATYGGRLWGAFGRPGASRCLFRAS